MKPFRSLENYKKMHNGTAKSKSVLEDFNSARTLTEARKILFGVKKKQTKAKK